MLGVSVEIELNSIGGISAEIELKFDWKEMGK